VITGEIENQRWRPFDFFLTDPKAGDIRLVCLKYGTTARDVSKIIHRCDGLKGTE
jgi:hypothetical protein